MQYDQKRILSLIKDLFDDYKKTIFLPQVFHSPIMCRRFSSRRNASS